MQALMGVVCVCVVLPPDLEQWRDDATREFEFHSANQVRWIVSRPQNTFLRRRGAGNPGPGSTTHSRPTCRRIRTEQIIKWLGYDRKANQEIYYLHFRLFVRRRADGRRANVGEYLIIRFPHTLPSIRRDYSINYSILNFSDFIIVVP